MVVSLRHSVRYRVRLGPSRAKGQCHRHHEAGLGHRKDRSANGGVQCGRLDVGELGVVEIDWNAIRWDGEVARQCQSMALALTCSK